MAAVVSAAVGFGAAALGVSTLAAAGIGLGAGLLNQQYQASRMQKKAMQQAAAASNAQAKAAEESMNRANQKSPDVGAMLSANQQAARGGQSGTMLTGPSGVDPSTLTLGKNTLLGA